MTQSVDVPTQEFCLDWTLTGNRGNHVGVTLSGQVKLLDGNRSMLVHRTRRSQLRMAAAADHLIDCAGKLSVHTYLQPDWARTSKPDVVLASTVWSPSVYGRPIEEADIAFNAEFYRFVDALTAEPRTDGGNDDHRGV